MLMKDEALQKQPSAVEALKDMHLLLKYCELYGVLDKVLVLLDCLVITCSSYPCT